MKRYIAFLRGINVGGHHKVPMEELRRQMQFLGFENIVTILNSGNIIFDASVSKMHELEVLISNHLQSIFGFTIPVLLRTGDQIQHYISQDPFKGISSHRDVRWYVSFLKADHRPHIEIPWISDDNSFKIILTKDHDLFSILDLSLSKTPKAMEIVERHYGKDVTTRNWKTIIRIGKKL